MHFLVVQVLEFWRGHFRELDKEWMDFNLDLDSLGDDCQQSALLTDAPQVPGVIRVVCCFWLEEGDGSELPCKEIEQSLFTIKLKVFNQVGSPHF